MLTDEETETLNRQVALVMGWQRIDAADVDGGAYWILPDGGMNDAPPHGTDYEGKRYGDFYVLPDFCRDPFALGWMLDWADAQDGVCLWTSRQSAHFWLCVIQQWTVFGIYEKAESRAESVARAVVRFSKEKEKKRCSVRGRNDA